MGIIVLLMFVVCAFVVMNHTANIDVLLVFPSSPPNVAKRNQNDESGKASPFYPQPPKPETSLSKTYSVPHSTDLGDPWEAPRTAQRAPGTSPTGP